MKKEIITELEKKGFKIDTNINYPTSRKRTHIKIQKTNTDYSIITDETTVQCYCINYSIDSYIESLNESFLKFDIEAVSKFEDISKYISVKFINKYLNIIDESTSFSFGDIVLIPIFEANNTTITITQKHLKYWNKTIEDIMSIAYKNMKGDIVCCQENNDILFINCNKNPFGAPSILVNRDITSMYGDQNIDSIILFPNQYQSNIIPIQPEVLESEKEGVIDYWIGYLDYNLRENNLFLSFNVNYYNAKDDTYHFGENDVYTSKQLDAIFGIK